MEKGQVTLLLQAARSGEEGATHRLMDAVYSELRAIADAKMRSERAGHTLQPTALVNEAFLRLVDNHAELEDRSHFFGAVAKAMERVLVDHARQRQALKRGGGAAKVTLEDVGGTSSGQALGVLEVHEVIETLDLESPELATLVRQRYFVGLTLEQIAEIDSVSLATVKRRWAFAKAWLFDALRADPPG
jgi:RNA polymerase sigma factor (TIGR02999 family)